MPSRIADSEAQAPVTHPLAAFRAVTVQEKDVMKEAADFAQTEELRTRANQKLHRGLKRKG